MLAGAMEPQLGGHPRYLDVVGVNYYHANQWEHPDQRLRWEDTPRDPRWLPFSSLLAEVYYRYWRPVVVSETSHFGAGRGRWIREVGKEVGELARQGCASTGCASIRSSTGPTGTTRTIGTTVGSGISAEIAGKLERVLNEEYATDLRGAQTASARPASAEDVGSPRFRILGPFRVPMASSPAADFPA